MACNRNAHALHEKKKKQPYLKWKCNEAVKILSKLKTHLKLSLTFIWICYLRKIIKEREINL